MNSPITLDALRILDAIDRRHSFAAAADELHRVPSAISYTINKLEEDLGVQLFDRSKRKAALTAVGRQVLEQGRQILIATEELTAQARQAADGWEMELRIAVDTVLDCEPIYGLIEAFQQLQPHTVVRLSEEVLGGSWDALNDNRCDLVIGATGDPPSQGFSTHILGQVVFEFAVATGHPLTQLNQPIPLSALHSHPTIVIADSSHNLPARSSGLLDGRSRILVATMAQKIQAQCRGLGIGYLPIHRIQEELRNGTLAPVQLLDSPHPAQTICTAWRNTNKGKGKALKWFIQQLKKMQFTPQKGLHMITD